MTPLSDNTLNHWLVVDLMRVPQAPRIIYREEPQPEMTRLFAGSQVEHLLECSPGIFSVSADTPLLERLTRETDWRTSSVIFSTPADVSPENLLTHLQNLLVVTIGGKQTLLRFYSTDFLNRIADALDSHDIDVLLGPATALGWAGADQGLRYLERSPPGRTNDDIAYVLTSSILSGQVHP